MNRLWFLLIVVTFAACKAPYFNNANNMRLINGTVYTKDGGKTEGQLSVNMENYHPSRLYVNVTPREGKEAKRINLTDIKGMEVRGDYYEPRLVDMGGLGNTNEFRFLRRITKEPSRIHLYELEQNVNRQQYSRYNRNTVSYTETQFSYYIVTPGHTYQMPAWNIEGRRLVPDFENKMSEIVKDCPALAEKIRRKEKGYFYAQVSLLDSKRVETMMTIIDEYNKCDSIKN